MLYMFIHYNNYMTKNIHNLSHDSKEISKQSHNFSFSKNSNNNIINRTLTTLSIVSTLAIWTTTELLTSCNSQDQIEEIVKEPSTTEPVKWLENLQNTSFQVDCPINLLKWITFTQWIELIQTQIEIDWISTIISDPTNFTPQYPWKCNIIFTIKWLDNNISNLKVENIIIKPLEYKPISIKYFTPEEILPIIWQIEWWDKQAYEHIEHLKIAEATKLRDMMRQYWAWNYTPQEYQQLISRLHTWMTLENPRWYSNYENIWWDSFNEPSDHAHNERNILNNIITHANFQIIHNSIDNINRDDALYQLTYTNPNNIYIFWNSSYTQVNTNEYIKEEYEKLRQSCKLKNCILFIAWSNIKTNNWITKNQILHQDIAPNQSWIYGLPSYANWQNDSQANNHILITIWTNSNWNIDQTDETTFGSKFPIWFHDDVLFSWRSFPYQEPQRWKIVSEDWKYDTSYSNYLNLALTDLCFQLFADINDVDELLNMIKTTSLTDYIKLNWDTQKLHLINPSWFIEKYLLPKDIPTEIQSWEIITLDKRYYKWIIFDIPWAEVNINWEWIKYNENNGTLIKKQNPFKLQWRLNWDLCKKMWYTSSNPIKWKIITVDDKFNWINISKDIIINITH